MPPVAVIVVLLPEQIATLAPAFIVGSALTVTVCVALFWHPFISVPVTVYVTDAMGEAVILLPVVDARPVEGDHV